MNIPVLAPSSDASCPYPKPQSGLLLPAMETQRHLAATQAQSDHSSNAAVSTASEHNENNTHDGKEAMADTKPTVSGNASSGASGPAFPDPAQSPILLPASSLAHIKHLAATPDKLHAVRNERPGVTGNRGPSRSTSTKSEHDPRPNPAKSSDNAPACSSLAKAVEHNPVTSSSEGNHHAMSSRSRITSISSRSINGKLGLELATKARSNSRDDTGGDTSSLSEETDDIEHAASNLKLAQYLKRDRTLQERARRQVSRWQRIRKQREVLYESRQELNQATMKFLSAVQSLLPRHGSLTKQIQKLQTLGLNVQAGEANVDDLIDEYEDGLLADLEEGPFSTNATMPRSPPAIELRGIEGVRRNLSNPLFENFENAIMNFRNQKEWQAYIKLRRNLLDLLGEEALSDDDRDFLRKHDEFQQEAAKEVARLETIAEKLEEVCRTADTIPSYSPLQEKGYWRAPYHADDIDLEKDLPNEEAEAKTIRTLAHPVYPHLLSNPKHLLQDPFPRTAKNNLRMASSLPPVVKRRKDFVEEAEKELEIESLLSSARDDDKDDFINRWLLQKLRLSPMEAEVLLGTFRSFLDVLDRNAWQHDVLSFWFIDIPVRLRINNHPEDASVRVNAADTSRW